MKDIHTQNDNSTQSPKRSPLIFSGIRGYQRAWLRLDVVAGITTAAVVVPKSMAYAEIAGLPVEIGLYTAFIPMVIYAILGTSRPLSVSTTSTIAILAANALAMPSSGANSINLVVAATTLAFLVGVFLMIAGIFRFGFVANFISDPVLTGFKAGIGVVIVVDQVPKLLGIHFAKGRFFSNVFSIFEHMPETHIPTLVLALTTLVLIIALERFWSKAPAPLFAVILGIAASGVLGLNQMGVELAGKIPSGLPAPVLPDLSLIRHLWPSALGIALMAFTESIAAGRAFVRKGDRQTNADRELIALGAANMVGGFFRIIPSGGGTSQTAVNDKAGAQTQAAQLVTAMIVVAVLLVLSPLISLMPKATLAAVVVATTVGLINPIDFHSILKIRKVEFWWSIIAFAGVVLLGTLPGILLAVVISVVTVMYDANHPPIYALGRKSRTNIFRPLSDAHPEDETLPGLLIVRTEGRMTFASAPRIRDKFWELVSSAQPEVLVMDCSAIPDIEYTALQMLIDAEEKLKEAGTILWLAALNPKALDVVRRSSLNEILGNDRMFTNLREAVDAFEEKL